MGSTPRSNLIPFCMSFWQKDTPLVYLSHKLTYLRAKKKVSSCQFHLVLNKLNDIVGVIGGYAIPQLWNCFIKWYQTEQSFKFCIHNGGWHETLNLLHVSSCTWFMVQFVVAYMNQIINVLERSIWGGGTFMRYYTQKIWLKRIDRLKNMLFEGGTQNITLLTMSTVGCSQSFTFPRARRCRLLSRHLGLLMRAKLGRVQNAFG